MSHIYQAKGVTINDQYCDVGRLFAAQLQKPIEFCDGKRILANKVLEIVKGEPILNTFYGCFAAWAEGAQISQEHAMYLLADNTSGCQTVMARYGSGIGMVHFEEDFDDPKLRMGANHTIEFRDGERSLKCLTYNDLMPGAGLYGWQDDMIVGVDSLFLLEDKIDEFERPMLANIVAWMIWFMKPSEADAQEIVKQMKRLGQMVDGYVINVIRKWEGETEAYKILFTRDEWVVQRLDTAVGATLFQINLIDQETKALQPNLGKWELSPDEIYDHPGFVARYEIFAQVKREYGMYLSQKIENGMVHQLHTQIQSTIYDNLAKDFVNEYLAASCVGLIDIQGTSVSCKLNDMKQSSELEYIDLV